MASFSLTSNSLPLTGSVQALREEILVSLSKKYATSPNLSCDFGAENFADAAMQRIDFAGIVDGDDLLVEENDGDGVFGQWEARIRERRRAPSRVRSPRRDARRRSEIRIDAARARRLIPFGAWRGLKNDLSVVISFHRVEKSADAG